MRRLLTMPLLLLAAGCSSLPTSVALSPALVPAPVPISATDQAGFPRIVEGLRADPPTLTRAQADVTIRLLTLLYVEREKLRAARATLSD